MIKKQYALFDTQLSIFHNPLHFLNHGDAIRWLTNLVNPPEGKEPSNISLHPHHFTLFYIGDLDDSTGKVGNWNEDKNELETPNKPKEIMAAVAVKEEETQTFTVKQLITMLKMELGKENVVEISNQIAEG